MFPADRLNALLTLQERILRKLAQAAKTIGVATMPLDGVMTGEQVFADTRAEIKKLAREEATIYEQSGTQAAAQTGEEYRQRLRAALQTDRRAVSSCSDAPAAECGRERYPACCFVPKWSCPRGVCTFLRFVPAHSGWKPSTDARDIVRETGTCLRLIDCTEQTRRHVPSALAENVFGFWEVALRDIMAEWELLSDPRNLQLQVRPFNRQVADLSGAIRHTTWSQSGFPCARYPRISLASEGGGPFARAVS